MASRIPRSVPDGAFNEIFARLPSHRDRALVAFYVSTGARASELLSVTQGGVDPARQLITVVRKGTGDAQQLPASSDAFVWLRLYQLEMDGLIPTGRRQPLWWTLRRPARPLTYHAAHRMFERVNGRAGTSATLHALRHTAAYRMAEDPALPLTDVQLVLGHAQLSTTQIYLTPRKEDVIRRLLAHHADQTRRATLRGAGTGTGVSTANPRGAVRQRPMTDLLVDDPAVGGSSLSAPDAADPTFPARRTPTSWPTTQLTREQAARLLTSPPFAAATAKRRCKRTAGVRLLLEWLADQPGESWQQRWVASGAEQAPRAWRQLPAAWLAERGHGRWHQEAIVQALPAAISADLVRPSLPWLVGGGPARGGRLLSSLETFRDPDGFARLRALCEADASVSAAAATQTRYRSALVLAAKGGVLADVTVGDVVELLDAQARVLVDAPTHGTLFYRLLRSLGIFGTDAPATLRALRTRGQRSPEQLIDRYGLACRPIRDLLVDYLRERQPALDYTSLVALSYHLGKRFWADLERHHPGIDSLHLPRGVADDWKRRLGTMTTTSRTESGETVARTVPRINYRECLTPVRAFYLDLAQWAVEDPGRWARWVAPCPVGAEEINRKKAKRQLKSRMDARTRERLPVLPVLVRSVNDHRRRTAELLEAARRTEPEATFAVAGQTLVRSVVARGEPGKVWAHDPATGRRRDLTREEDHAFWAWAVVEVLRATGIRVEELTELSHHSLVQYRLPTTGDLVPLLQILPSKTDAERLLVVSPELADVLATIISRIRSGSGVVPAVAAYDPRERAWAPPAPLLFQHPVAGELRAITAGGVRGLLNEALAGTGLLDPVNGRALHFTPHDFRRIFITDAIANGLPPHIAQIIAGHQDINVTLGYKAVYPEESIQAHLAFLARRRALRPSEEYRTPTDEEWQEFLGHFERRKVSVGTCARAFGTPCVHEHACVRCPMLWPDPGQRSRLVEIRDNTLARIEEAEREGWLGEVEGLRVSLAAADDKLAQIDRRAPGSSPTRLGMPTVAPTGDRITVPAADHLGRTAG